MILDARGLRCPMPIIRLAALARGLEPGDEVEVRWTDLAARHDIPAWARMRGHEALGTVELDEGWATTVRLGPPAAS